MSINIRSKDDFKLTGVFMNKEEWSNIVLFTKATVVILFMTGVKILSFLTRFFPFSLIGRNKSFHYRNRDIRKVMTNVDVACKKADKEFMVEAGERDQYFYTIKGFFAKSKKRINQENVIKSIEKQFELPRGNVFIRNWKGNKKRLLIPIEVNSKN